ncbi:Right handed beta helix region [Streptomyces sp. 1222.5]|uniref:right-handed parallel beta-helix repeat-containing protein n=1 Tax=unclassified Streptomyces TaxID=2593676 RepID=UPI00089BF1DB|nr:MULTISPECIES: right-handed parallel beta-helix repeat-containing protein [unclassified Streptomyces]PKW07374.1 parallel beta helix pectate lyase-like protein [Streptomyces sp. 5112.2]SEC90490.1 Right handed beta helix region [Streptomyces sp. 1222.5]
MTKRHISYLACTTALIGALAGTTPASAAHRIHVVNPGESIQKAVDAAKTGDTVLVLAGTYHESVTVKTPGLTLRGVGPRTVIEPVKKKAVAHSAKSARGAKASVSCLEGGNGVCVVGGKNTPLKNVTVADLKVSGFSRIGLWSMGTDRLTVERVTADDNGQWGIAQEHSTRGVFRENTARRNGDAGLFLANNVKAEEGATDSKGAVVERNRLEDNRIGVTVRRLRNLTVTHNYVTGNCAGVFVVGDENKPKAGSLTVTGNHVVRNNKYCAKTARLPYLKGSGIVLTGTEKALVTRNVVTGHSGKSPLSGGIVLFKSFVGVTSERNRITGNWLEENSPADLVNQESTKSANAFDGNSCRASKPAGLC